MSLTLDQLADDALLAVMQYLSVDDLLACRLVCKRLAGLAMHPDIWRHQRIYVDKRCACAVLQLAPCAKAIIANGYRAHITASTLARARCAAERLELCVAGQGPKRPERRVMAPRMDIAPRPPPWKFFSATRLALVVRNQALLGRLRRVVVEHFPPYDIPGVAALLQTAAMCSGLEELYIHYPSKLRPAERPPVISWSLTSTLKCFRCNLHENAESFVNTLLAGHAATLEEVDLRCFGARPSRDTAGLLAAMPNLRKLIFDELPGLEDVARCATLRDVEIRQPSNVDDPEPEVAKFLRQATQLRSISLDFPSEREFCDLLLQTLASSPRPLLEELTVRNPPMSLVLVLPQLSGLRNLHVHGLVGYQNLLSELLLGITPATAPALRLLKLKVCRHWRRCAHVWLHSNVVEEVLRANPLLHIILEYPNACELDGCEACNSGCHKEVVWNKPLFFIGLYSHDPDVCPSPKDHHPTDYKVVWLHFPCNSV